MKMMIATVVLLMLTGCGQLMGVRKIDAWGLHVEYSEGLMTRVGFNTVDRVDDRQGVARIHNAKDLPQGGY